jgi:hypothetical protein
MGCCELWGPSPADIPSRAELSGGAGRSQIQGYPRVQRLRAGRLRRLFPHG